MGKKKKASQGFGTRTVFKYLRIASLFAPAVQRLFATGKFAYNQEVGYQLVADYTGFYARDGSFDIKRIIRGWGPYVMTVVMTYGVPKLAGLIRRFK